ncbi:MAG: hypothetical protein ABIO58_07045 [Luteimonas sp.]
MTTTLRTLEPAPTRPPVAQAQKPVAARREYRERDFGIGYGRSSGYASNRRYANAWGGLPHFRCG